MNGVLEKLLGSASRVKIIRLFLANPEGFFTLEDVSRRAKVAMPLTRREISLFKSIDLIKQREETVEETIKLKSGETKTKKKKVVGYSLNAAFPFLHPLKNLFANVAPVDKEKVVKELGSVGKIKLVIFSGVFIQSDGSRVDLLLVGDAIRETKLDKVLKNIEAEIGREITYTVFKTEDFLYRLGMYDKFIRDVLEYPHEKALNKINV
ncbi:MAG: hypothetical protein L6Q29_01455 [Candidatus Pacebacteria bacterium]|nr:hypothetical protein [Candidatus Paceibacterota bacterium]